MTKQSVIPSELRSSHTLDCEASRHEKSESATPHTLLDDFLALLENSLPEMEMEPLPAGMLCPIRSVCPDRGMRSPSVLIRSKA